jgi:radical SAM superfamily enzyme
LHLRNGLPGARQIWSFNAAKEITEADADVLKLYELACGYDPRDPTR